MIEETLVGLLTSLTPHVHAVLAPMNSPLPLLVYTRASTTRVQDMEGPTGVAISTFRIDVYDDQFLECRKLSKRVRDLLDGIATPQLSVSCEQENDLSDLSGAMKIYRVALQFRITHDE